MISQCCSSKRMSQKANCQVEKHECSMNSNSVHKGEKAYFRQTRGRTEIERGGGERWGAIEAGWTRVEVWSR